MRLPLNGTPNERALTTAFPQKGSMVLQRTRPPLLETPWEVFDKGVFTPNDPFFVRGHWAVIPEQVDAAAYRLAIRGHINAALSRSLADLLALPCFEIATTSCNPSATLLLRPNVSELIRSLLSRSASTLRSPLPSRRAPMRRERRSMGLGSRFGPSVSNFRPATMPFPPATVPSWSPITALPVIRPV